MSEPIEVIELQQQLVECLSTAAADSQIAWSVALFCIGMIIGNLLYPRSKEK
jgi:hypothetical protein